MENEIILCIILAIAFPIFVMAIAYIFSNSKHGISMDYDICRDIWKKEAKIFKKSVSNKKRNGKKD